MTRRKTKPTRDNLIRILDIIRLGAGISAAAATVGAETSTIYKWLKKGESEDAPELLAWFAKEYRKAEVSQKTHLLELVEKAGEKDWKAAAWILEKRWPKEFGNRQYWEGRMQLEAKREQPVDIKLLTRHEIAQLRDIQLKLAAGKKEPTRKEKIDPYDVQLGLVDPGVIDVDGEEIKKPED